MGRVSNQCGTGRRIIEGICRFKYLGVVMFRRLEELRQMWYKEQVRAEGSFEVCSE